MAYSFENSNFLKALDEIEMKDKLLKRESPFSWNMPQIDMEPETYIKVQMEKYKNMEEENEFQWSRLIISLLLSYELCNSKDYSGALTQVQWCDDHLRHLQNKQCKETLFCYMYITLGSVVSTTKAIILLKSGQLGKACEEAIKWPAHSGELNQSAILGTKAALYVQYGTTGHRMAYDAALKAKELNPNIAEWHFLIGNALGRIRRVEYKSITEEEVAAIEKSYRLEKNASNTVHLAQLYSELSSFWFFERHPNKTKQYTQKAVDSFREAIAMRPNCDTLKARVVHGMLRIRDRSVRDIPYTKRLLDDLLKTTTNNSMVYHDVGYYYEVFENNTSKAIVNLEKAVDIGNIQALGFLIKLKWKQGMKEEIVNDLKQCLEKYKTQESQALLWARLGAFYALDDNWDLALESIRQSLDVDPTANYLEKCAGFNGKDVNLLQLVVRHIHCLPDYKRPTMSTDFLNFVKEKRPNIDPSAKQAYSFSDWKQDQFRSSRGSENTTGMYRAPRTGSYQNTTGMYATPRSGTNPRKMTDTNYK